MEQNMVVIAPHPDDEIIGCFQMLDENRVVSIIYGTENPCRNTVAELFQCDCFISKPRDVERSFLTKGEDEFLFLFPDPYFETHPSHRMWGAVGERMLREQHKRVLFYSVNMKAPYIFETPIPYVKRKALEKLYPEKKSLWESDHRYFLFEGYCEWNLGRGVR